MVELVEATSCTSCISTDIRTKRKYIRSQRFLHGVETVVVTQYECRDFKRTFTDRVDGVGYRAQIADEVKDASCRDLFGRIRPGRK